MKINQEKTKVTASRDGADFLGWYIYLQSNEKFKSIFSRDNFKYFRNKIKHIVNNSNYGAVTKVQKLAFIVIGCNEITTDTAKWTERGLSYNI